LKCEVYDIERNALTCKVKKACIYHPPCRTWGRLRKQTILHPGEHLLSVWSILRIWKYGGVLEHPAGSTLWKLMKLPIPGTKPDIHNGFSVSLDQSWFGHKCKKNTWVYICGCSLGEIPQLELSLDLVTHKIGNSKKNSGLKELDKAKFSQTPVKFAKWLIETTNIINLKTKTL
jgi:hypothetical protein